jgi:nicotinate-nucleotide adenylyltransferase
VKIGVFGGTFNPPHIGHLIVAEHVRTEASLDKVLFVPAAISPHKLHQDPVPAHHRLAMLRLAIQGNPNLDVSDVEIQRGGVSFTVHTLEQFRRDFPADKLSLLIGMDILPEFHTWKSPESILELADVIVVTRPGFDTASVPQAMRNRIRICSVPEIGVASRDLRERVHSGKSIRYLVSDAVDTYIRRHNLYPRTPLTDVPAGPPAI